MKTVRDVMTSDVVWVSPSARVKTAVILIKGHKIGALPVLHSDNAVVGLVTHHSLLGEPEDSAVLDVMSPDFVSVDPEMSVYDAAVAMYEGSAGHLIVVEDGKLIGIVSHGDLLPELGKAFDPLTELPWADSFREWAMNALKRGMEISLILFDLDQFGSFNKRHGHVMGDRVIKEVAEVFKKGVDPDLDFLCRYGGDEFGIVSIRHADEAIALADILRERVSQLQIDGLPEGVTTTYGMYGGRRTKEREDIHYAATIDDLITRASKECTARKPHRARPEAALQSEAAPRSTADGSARAARLKIQTITISTSGEEARAAVTLARSGREFSRESGGYVIGGKNVLRLVAEATAGAACRSIAEGHGIVVDDVAVHQIGEEDQLVTVIAVFIGPRMTTRHVGSAVVKRGDQYRAAAAALLNAVNRLIESVPEAESIDEA